MKAQNPFAFQKEFDTLLDESAARRLQIQREIEYFDTLLTILYAGLIFFMISISCQYIFTHLNVFNKQIESTLIAKR